MGFLYHAEPCDGADADPFADHPGVRVKAGQAILGRLSPTEAIALARDLLNAAQPADKDIR